MRPYVVQEVSGLLVVITHCRSVGFVVYSDLVLVILRLIPYWRWRLAYAPTAILRLTRELPELNLLCHL